MPRILPVEITNSSGLRSTSMYAHVPSIQEGARALDVGIGAAGRIPPQLRKLMNVKAASLVGCPF